MELYHASPAAGLRVLRPSVTKYFGKPRRVCLTALRPMALFYGVHHFEYTYGYARDGMLCYEEYFPGALEELYRAEDAAMAATLERFPEEAVAAMEYYAAQLRAAYDQQISEKEEP